MEYMLLISADTINNIFSFVIGPVFAAGVGWFFGRRKLKADAEGGELDNVEKGLGIYRKMIEDLMKGQSELRVEIDTMKVDNKVLKEKLHTFVIENKGLKQENSKLRSRVSHLEKELEVLKQGRNE